MLNFLAQILQKNGGSGIVVQLEGVSVQVPEKNQEY